MTAAERPAVARFAELWLDAERRALDRAAQIELAVFREGASVHGARRVADTCLAKFLYEAADRLLAECGVAEHAATLPGAGDA